MTQEETQTEEVQAPEMSDDELWESTLKQEETNLEQQSEEVQTEAEEVQEPQAEEIQAEEEPEHDWQKRYKDLERDYHKRNEDTASFRRESDTKMSDLEKQIQQMRIERLELENNFKKQSEAPVDKAPDPSNLEEYLNDTERQTMSDLGEVMGVVQKLIDHKLAKTPTPEFKLPEEESSKFQQMQEAVNEMRFQQWLASYDKTMRDKVGGDYMEIDNNKQFIEFVNSNDVLKDTIVESNDADKHAQVLNLWLTTEDGKAFRKKEDPQSTAATDELQKKRESKRSAASGLVKNSPPVQETDESKMSDDELWDHLMSEKAS